MKRSILYSTYFLLVLLFIPVPCSGNCGKPADISDTLINYLNRLSFTGQHDSVIQIARPELQNALNNQDTLTAIYTGSFIAQSFLFLEDMDSAQFYTELLKPMQQYPAPPNIHIMLSNVLGSYSLRTSLDYSKALNYYIDGLTWAEQSGEITNQIALLSNIVNIFYIQNNPKGMKYAEKAYRLAMEDSAAGDYSKCAANIVMAQMLFIQDRKDEAIPYLFQAEKYADAGHALSSYSYIYSLLAQIYADRRDYIKAALYYKKAVDYINYTDPGAASQVYLTYGNFLANTGDSSKAANMYKKGLAISETSGNLEYRQALLGNMADLAYDSGDWTAAAEYSRMYKLYSESISSRRKAEFNDLIMSKQQTENEKIVLTKELERRKANERFLKLLFIFAIVLILSCFVFIMYQRQRKMYRELVKKHQEYISRLDHKFENGADKDNSKRDLFNRIEDLMRNGKIYRMNSLSREMLAEKLNTNQNYISKAINTFAGMPFNKYVDTFRINEAARIISQSPDSILFKQLANDVGYNSVTVFSKAFQRETGCSPSIYRKEINNRKGEKIG